MSTLPWMPCQERQSIRPHTRRFVRRWNHDIRYGNPFTFSGAIAAGTFDFQGIAAHEMSEVMGRLGLSGGSVDTTANSFSLSR